MKIAAQLAFRNLIGAKLRTSLNALVLSFSFIVILFFQGIMDGWKNQAINDTVDWEYGASQLWHVDFDPYDPLSFQDAHADYQKINSDEWTAVLYRQATAYPEGRLTNVTLKGIDAKQRVLKIPTQAFSSNSTQIEAIVGKRFAETSKLFIGDDLLIRWRNRHGMYDAAELKIIHIFDSNVPTIDVGQIWIPLADLQKMTGYENEATILIAGDGFDKTSSLAGFIFKSEDDLLANLREIMKTEQVGNSFFYLLLMCIALLALFDTQVLSIFRRQKEIGTYIALGMTRFKVMKLFTIEGTMYSLFALLLSAIYGTPILWYFQKIGIGMPEMTDDMGIAMASRMYPEYSLFLVVSTTVLMVIAATIVSYMPARKITKIDVINALKGKVL